MQQKLSETGPSISTRSGAAGPGPGVTAGEMLDWQFADVRAKEELSIDRCDWVRPDTLTGATLVKENVQRQVWRVELGGKCYYVKLYLKNGWWRAVKRQFRGPPCLKEWRVAQYALEKRVNCVKPVAYAISSDPKSRLDCLLITEGLPGSLPLIQYWQNLSNDGDPTTPAAIRKLQDALAELLAKAHRAGIAHCDLHPGNLLVEVANGQPKVYLVDLHSVKIHKTVSKRAATETLAQLNQWFQQNATLTQRMRLLKRYIECRRKLAYLTTDGWLGETFRRWVKSLDRAARAHSRRLWASRDRRVMKTGKYFAKLKLRNYWQAHVFLRSKRRYPCSTASQFEFTLSGWKGVLAEPEKMLDELLRQSRPMKHSRSTLVCKGDLQIGRHRVAVVCKRRIRYKRLAAVWDCLRDSRSLRAWKMGFAMLHRGLPVAQPMAVLERRVGPYLADCLLITEEVRPAVNLRVFLTTVLPVLDAERRNHVKRTLLDSLAGLLRKMHRNGFVHRDLKATNILIHGATVEDCRQLDPSKLKLVLVDLDALSLKRRAREREQLRALARLSVSADLSPYITLADRVRFLKTYLTCYGSGVPDWKRLWRDIETERDNRFPDHLAG